MVFLCESCAVLDLIDVLQCNLHNNMTKAAALARRGYKYIEFTFLKVN